MFVGESIFSHFLIKPMSWYVLCNNPRLIFEILLASDFYICIRVFCVLMLSKCLLIMLVPFMGISCDLNFKVPLVTSKSYKFGTVSVTVGIVSDVFPLVPFSHDKLSSL